VRKKPDSRNLKPASPKTSITFSKTSSSRQIVPSVRPATPPKPREYESNNANTLSTEDSDTSSTKIDAQFLAAAIEDIREHTIAFPPAGKQDIELTHSLDLLA
jgi:hypothetical protein